MISAPTDPPDLVGDDFGPYQLPPRVAATIPAAAVPGEPTLHRLARGLIVETAARLDAAARFLDVIALDGVVIIGIEVAISGPAPAGPPGPAGTSARVGLTVVPADGRWMLAVQGRVIAAGCGVPAPRRLAPLVAGDHVHASQEAG